MGSAHHEEHKHGSMDITVHERTFDGFIRATKWAIGFCIAVLVFLAIFNT